MRRIVSARSFDVIVIVKVSHFDWFTSASESYTTFSRTLREFNSLNNRLTQADKLTSIFSRNGVHFCGGETERWVRAGEQ